MSCRIICQATAGLTLEVESQITDCPGSSQRRYAVRRMNFKYTKNVGGRRQSDLPVV